MGPYEKSCIMRLDVQLFFVLTPVQEVEEDREGFELLFIFILKKIIVTKKEISGEELKKRLYGATPRRQVGHSSRLIALHSCARAAFPTVLTALFRVPNNVVPRKLKEKYNPHQIVFQSDLKILEA